MLETNKIHEGDCLQLMPAIPDQSVDMILCDLPYGITACEWDNVIPFEPLWEQYKRIIKPRGAIVLTASQPFTSKLVCSNLDWFRYEWIWEKTVFGNPFALKYQPARLHETVLIFGKESPKYNPQMKKGAPYQDKARPGGLQNQDSEGGTKKAIDNKGTRHPSSVVKIANPNNHTIHPTQKPVDLFAYLIRTYTDEGDTVLDNCIGSGTTGVAALNTGRNFIGIEQSPEYVEIARKRIARETRQERLTFE